MVRLDWGVGAQRDTCAWDCVSWLFHTGRKLVIGLTCAGVKPEKKRHVSLASEPPQSL